MAEGKDKNQSKHAQEEAKKTWAGRKGDAEIEKLKQEREEYKDTLQRLQAEFENFQKRALRENEEFRKFASVRAIEEFLPVVDSVWAGISQAQKSGNREMQTGFETVLKQLSQALERNEVKRIDSVGKKFDHNLHEVMMIANEKENEDGVVLEEFQRGYTVNGKVLRPAKVKVNKTDKKEEKSEK